MPVSRDDSVGGARRMWRRVFSPEELWNGNRERLREHFFSRDSLYLWVFKTYWRRRREYPVHLRRREFAHLTVVRLRSPRATDEWLTTLPD